MTIAAFDEVAPVVSGATGNEPKIAYVRWLSDHPGKRPSHFQPIIREAEFAYRCRAPSVPACDDLGGTRIMERQLRNLELGLCCGWRVLTPSEARSLADWLAAVLPHHPLCASLGWRDSDERASLQAYAREVQAQTASRELLQSVSAAGLGDVLNQACSIETWRDVQALVLGAWMGGELLVDHYGYLVPGWREAFAHLLAEKSRSLE